MTIRLLYKTRINFYALLILFLLWDNYPVFSQPIYESLKEKLSRPDRYKLTKAMVFTAKGNAIIAKIQKVPVAMPQDTEQNYTYSANRIEASYCYMSANGLLYQAFDKNIKKCRNKFSPDNRPPEILRNIENAAYDSLIKADKLREQAEEEMNLEAKIPIVSRAEQIESNALLKLAKILYLYLNPAQTPDLAWLLSDSRDIPGKQVVADRVLIKFDTSGTKKTSGVPLHLTDSRKEEMKEFSVRFKPDDKLTNAVNFQKLYDSVIDSVHKEWHKETLFSNIHSDISETTGFAGNKTNFSSEVVYKVQIAACRTSMDSQMLGKIYAGPEKVTEVFGDGWFRYTVGEFKSREEADNFKNDKVPVKNAFITVYSNGKRIK